MPSAFLTTPSTISKQLGSLSSLLQASPSPKGDAGLQATLMQGQQEFGSVPQKQVGTSFQSESLSPFDAPKKMNPADLFGQQQSVSAPTNTFGRNGGSLGSPGSLGGEYAVLDQYDSAFQRASAETGIPVNTLKAIAAVERGWEGTSVAGAVGIMQVMPGIWGHLGNVYDPYENILVGAKVLKSNLDQYGSMDMAIRGYLGFGQDAYGTTDSAYLDRVRQFENQLNQSGGSFGQVGQINGLWGGNESGNSIVGIAQQYLGTPYVWGGIPGKGDTPTGWDCSGFTYWLDQNYGNGQLPMGSHYQYQYAQQTGSLFQDTNQLQPGDLIFFDTGNYAGGGAELNNAGHVAMYIGNGQIIHAANPTEGTIISNLSGYYMDRYIGAMHSSYSGGYGGSFGGQQSGSQGQYGSFAQQIRSFLQNRR